MSFGMRTRRLVVAHGVILALVGGGLYDVATGREHWPFSPYTMFSDLDLSRTATRLAVVGIDEGRGLEVPRSGAWAVRPLGARRLGAALGLLLAEPGGGQRVAVILAQLLARYEQLRLQGRHSGPRLASFRLYRLEWDVDSAVDGARPADRRTLIVEARRQ